MTTTATAHPFPVGSTVELAVDCELRDVSHGMTAVVVETFAPLTGRNVRLADGRIVNVSRDELVDAPADDDVVELAAHLAPFLPAAIERYGSLASAVDHLVALMAADAVEVAR